MPDISMCSNMKCEKRNTCYRFLATPTPNWQTYGVFKPDDKGECEYYWEVRETGEHNAKQTK